jgi:hypothetical protein
MVAAGVGGAVAAVAPYIGAAAAVPHDGSNYCRGPRQEQRLPSWPKAVGCRGPRSPQRTVGGVDVKSATHAKHTTSRTS